MFSKAETPVRNSIDGSSKSIGLQRQATKRIPDQWDLEGNVAIDPIANSLLVRIKEGALIGNLLEAPQYHKTKKAPRHKINFPEIFQDLTVEPEDPKEPQFEVPIEDTPKKRRNTLINPPKKSGLAGTDSKLKSQLTTVNKSNTKSKIPKYVPDAHLSDKHIPTSWQLEGNLKRDPIAISLLIRINAGSNNSIVTPPPGHVIQRPPAHEVKGISFVL